MFFKESEKCYENASQHFELWVTDFFEKSKNKKNTSLTLKILIMLEWCASTISWPLLCFGFKKKHLLYFGHGFSPGLWGFRYL